MAESVWVDGAAYEMYAHYGFAASFEVKKGEKPVLRMSAASVARVWVNGEFAGYGPARAPEGFMRIDEWPLEAFVRDGTNRVAIEVSNPAVNQFYLPERDGFLWAEVVSDGKILAVTGRDFKVQRLDRVKKVNRMSYQRAPAEFWRMTRTTDRWRTEGICGAGLPLERRPELKPLDRGGPLPDFAFEGNFHPTVRTQFTRGETKRRARILTVEKACPQGPLKGFAPNELEIDLHARIRDVLSKTNGPATLPVRLTKGEGVAFRGDFLTAGFPRLELSCTKPAVLYLMMDDVAGEDGLPDPLRMTTFPDVCGWQLTEPGDYVLDCFEPYAFSAAHLIVDDGAVTVRGFAVRSIGNPETKRASFRCSDPAFDRIFEAAKRSLRWNAVDCFTDCPARERAVYFGDTTFTARGADVLLGDTRMERTQFENYALARDFKDVPKGMIPMCYPADVRLSEPHWIPNFALWSVIQLEGYLARSGDRATVDAYRPKAEGILGWFRRCGRNEAGLLTNMPGWVFVEWSDAQKLVTGTSYVSNMFYIRFLDAMAQLYGRTDCAREAESMRQAVRSRSFNGTWFADNETGKCSELCQYAAFLARVATPETHAALWKRLVSELGPSRRPGVCPEVLSSNMLFGHSIRMVLLTEAGCSEQALADVRQACLPMAEKTGTLWEGYGDKGNLRTFSACHGFPSLAAWVIARAALGLERIDRAAKTVTFKTPVRSPLAWCAAELPLPGKGCVSVKVRRIDGKPVVDAAVPAGWIVRIRE